MREEPALFIVRFCCVVRTKQATERARERERPTHNKGHQIAMPLTFRNMNSMAFEFDGYLCCCVYALSAIRFCVSSYEAKSLFALLFKVETKIIYKNKIQNENNGRAE